MNNMIRTSSGFQYSVNIAYDLNNEDRLKNFIPTKSTIGLLEDILLSTRSTSTDRSRILIGAYGKGKSHIVLMVLAMLMKKDLNLFKKTISQIKQMDGRLYRYILNYYEGDMRILPVVISGSSTSLTQAFMIALQRTLVENNLIDIMPATNYKAAIAAIERWKTDFPATYDSFLDRIKVPVKRFLSDLDEFKIEAYEEFEKVYPTLTAGSLFNPFLGFDVVDLYEGVAKSLESKGYNGIYVVYDEFSKFLEANISEASISDTKTLQDFAEKCNRSGDKQLHLMLISHKEIASYIDVLPKQKVDGWRGVSERFKHIHLNNNFSQTYEIIAAVIQKKKKEWSAFCIKHRLEFSNLILRYERHPMFSDGIKKEAEKTIYECFPLHPVSTFILPRLSEKVAQNERTLFTFLSASGVTTLPALLAKYDDGKFMVITPDAIYDYFEPLLKKEIYSSNLHEFYILSTMTLNKLEKQSLESKIIKTLSLIYILEQFEKIKPTKEEIVGIFSMDYTVKEIECAINNLIEKEYVVYLKRSNAYLKLKQTSGVNIQHNIKAMVEIQRNRIQEKDVLNSSNFDSYLYPTRYNDKKEMMRFFAFEFIDENEITKGTKWNIKSEGIEADGIVYGIIPRNKESIDQIKKMLLQSSKGYESHIFVIPSKYTKIEDVVREYNAVLTLRDKAVEDPVMFEEYDVIYEDLKEIMISYINMYTHPEELKATYIHNAKEQSIARRASLTGLMSTICESIYSKTPVINNEMVNKMEISAVANNSRNKIISGLLRNEIEHNLGLAGTGQEVSIMRSTLIRTGILINNMELPALNLNPENQLIRNMLGVIVDFIIEARTEDSIGFHILYARLMSSDKHIGLRKGVIPIYLAAVCHEYKKEIIIKDKFGQVPLIADTLIQINCEPKNFSLSYLDWDPEKEIFIEKIGKIFKESIVSAEKTVNSYDYVVTAMKRWYMSLPKYTKEAKHAYKMPAIDRHYAAFIKLLKQNLGSHETIFKKIPESFGYKDNFNAGLADEIQAAKNYFDRFLFHLKEALLEDVREIFALTQKSGTLECMSISSVIQDWCETLDETVFEHLFSNGTDKCLSIFKTVTNDENAFISRLAKATIDLRLDDWAESTIEQFKEKLRLYKETAEKYHQEAVGNIEGTAAAYQVTFMDEKGALVTKRFGQVENSSRGKMLYNTIQMDIEAMGQSISEQEKRQILMEVLKNMC